MDEQEVTLYATGYSSVARVLEQAFEQCSNGKGNTRHAIADEPFEEQIICWLQRRGYDGTRFQAAKKIDESLRMNPGAAIKELLGAINYLAATIIVLEEKLCKPESDQITKS